MRQHDGDTDTNAKANHYRKPVGPAHSIAQPAVDSIAFGRTG
jgi:hypothetical protein